MSKRKINEPTSYPALANMLDGWFHQDYDINGTSLEEILPHFIRAKGMIELENTVSDIERFLADYDDNSDNLEFVVEEVFDPGVIIEGWNGLTTKEWLERAKQLIQNKLSTLALLQQPPASH